MTADDFFARSKKGNGQFTQGKIKIILTTPKALNRYPLTSLDMPSTRRAKAALDSAPKTSSEPRKSPKRNIKGSAPKVTGRRSKTNWKTDRIMQLLRLGDKDDYPPSIAEINAATRIIDLEAAIQNSKSSDHDKIERKIKEAFLKLNSVLSKRRPDPQPRTGENGDNPIELEDWDASDSENGTGETNTKKTKERSTMKCSLTRKMKAQRTTNKWKKFQRHLSRPMITLCFTADRMEKY